MNRRSRAKARRAARRRWEKQQSRRERKTRLYLARTRSRRVTFAHVGLAAVTAIVAFITWATLR